MKTQRWYLFWTLYALMLTAQGQQLRLNGLVISSDERRVLAGASVQLVKTKIAGYTDEDGRFFLSGMEPGSYDVVIRYVGYLTHKKRILVKGDTTLTVQLIPFSTELDEVTIEALRQSSADNPQANSLTLSAKQLRNVSSIGGEHDIARVLALTPGVKTDNEANSGLFVRGGSPDQNLFLIDNVPLYKNSHFFGFLSPFNSDVVQQVHLYRGGFPARFGGRLSSILDVKLRTASMEKNQLQGSIGILSSRVSLDIPLVKDRASLLIAGRRSYFDVFTRLFPGSGTTSGPNYYFYDLTGKLAVRIGSHTNLRIFAFQNQDRLRARARNDLEDFRYDQHWNSNILGTSVTTQVSKSLINTFELNLSTYKLTQTTQEAQQAIRTNYSFANSLKTNTVRNSVDWVPSEHYQMRIGGTAVEYKFQPGNLLFTGQGDTANKSLDSTVINELSSFLESELSSRRMSSKAGVRYATFQSGGQSRYNFVEPRLSIQYKIKPTSSVILAYARMNQPIHLLTNPGFGLPVDLWFPTKGPVKPQRSDQFSITYSRTLQNTAKSLLDLSIDAYYKTMSRIITYRDGYSAQDFTAVTQNAVRQWETIMITGKGISYGTEMLLQKKQGRLTGWVGYTLSWTRHQFDEINQGRPFHARHDRRHDLSIVGTYPLNKRWSVNGTWVYQTGQAVTLPQAVYSQTDFSFLSNRFNVYSPVVFTYGERNSYRMKASHRMDISIQRKTTHKWGAGQIELNVYNLYNRRNPYFYYLAAGNRVKAVSLFQLIPSLSYSFTIYTGAK